MDGPSRVKNLNKQGSMLSPTRVKPQQDDNASVDSDQLESNKNEIQGINDMLNGAIEQLNEQLEQKIKK